MHSFSVFDKDLQEKTLTLPQDYRADTIIGFYVQRSFKAWKDLFSRSPFTDLSKVIASHALVESIICQFQVLATCSEYMSPLSQLKTLVDVDGRLMGRERMETAVFDCSANTDNALRPVLYFMFNLLRSLVLNCKFYSKGEG